MIDMMEQRQPELMPFILSILQILSILSCCSC